MEFVISLSIIPESHHDTYIVQEWAQHGDTISYNYRIRLP